MTQPIAVKLIGPSPSAHANQVLKAWGVPAKWDFEGIPLAIHHSAAGHHVFELPPIPEVLAFAQKMSTRKIGHPILVILGHLLLFSQYRISDVVDGILPELASFDHVIGYPIAREEWDRLDALGELVCSHRSRHQSWKRLA